MMNTSVAPKEKRDIKLVVSLYPTSSQARGLILIIMFTLLLFGLPAGWMGVEQKVKNIEEHENYWVMTVKEEPGFIRSLFRHGGEYTYIRKLNSKGGAEWYTYPDSRKIQISFWYEDMFTGWSVEKTVDHDLKKDKKFLVDETQIGR